METPTAERRTDAVLAAALLAAFSLPALAGTGAPDYGSLRIHAANVLLLAPQALLFILIIDMRPGRAARESRVPFLRELPVALLLAGLLVGLGLAASLVGGPSGGTGGTAAGAAATAAATAAPARPALLWPLLLLSALSVGAREEALYRVLVPGLLGRAGASKSAAFGIPLAAFALGHLSQGTAGVVSALALGGALSLARARGSSLRVLALAHGLYDALAMAAAAAGA